MHNLLPKLKRAFPFLGERSASEDDFFQFCADHKITVVFESDISIGVYVLCGGESFIFLNNKLRGWYLRYVMYHELAHYLFHSPSQSNARVEFFHLHSKRKNHFEAEAAAALLLLPTLELHTALQDPEVYISDELQGLIKFRLDLWGRYKI
ncbi:MAG: ImmA/IrrE family metallo-endopeptidase [Pyrinomonadaceae bacterium]